MADSPPLLLKTFSNSQSFHLYLQPHPQLDRRKNPVPVLCWIDAAYKTIKAVEKSLNGSNPKVVVCIQTDGHENASTEHTWDELNALIKEKSAAGWQFNFLGTGIDAYDTGAHMGSPNADDAQRPHSKMEPI
jgi:hypothetical protein